MLLEGKNAIVTGGSQGIGTAASLELAKEGANVCLTFRRHADEARAVVDQKSKEMGRKAICVACDIAVFAEAEAAVNDGRGRLRPHRHHGQQRRHELGRRVLEDVRGAVGPGDRRQPEGVFQLHPPGGAACFKAQKCGKIINVTSINGMRGKFGQTNYSASKAGIIGYTKAVAKELGAFGVNVNAVAPGLIETAMLKGSDARDKIIDLAMAEMALKRIGQPEDLASVIAFLASDKARHITGEVIKVDGGQYI
jgi:3-oxoacyl-[acyl-carrier protein] reductase